MTQIVEERQKDYGHPTENFDRTAKLANAMQFRIFDSESASYRALNASDVPIFMLCVKMAREAYKHKEDNIIDMMGYLHTFNIVREHEVAHGKL